MSAYCSLTLYRSALRCILKMVILLGLKAKFTSSSRTLEECVSPLFNFDFMQSFSDELAGISISLVACVKDLIVTSAKSMKNFDVL